VKRFLLFLGDAYYPTGGMKDFWGDFDTFEDAMKHSTSPVVPAWDWVQIYDTEKREIVYENG